MKNTVRKMLVPRIFWVRARAIRKAMMLMTTRETTANRAVYQKA